MGKKKNIYLKRTGSSFNTYKANDFETTDYVILIISNTNKNPKNYNLNIYFDEGSTIEK
jgi:hypothetical protein